MVVRWNWLSWVCAIVVSVSACGELRADEAAEPRAGEATKPLKGSEQAGAATKVSGQGAALRDAIEGVLRAQQEAWNGGNVRAFMDHYWKSDDLTFSSGGKTTRGWKATLNGYLLRYPTREKMGQLRLGGLEITPLGDAAALVLGKWRLDGLGEPVGGNFTIVFRKIDGRWVIVHDHTSRFVENQ